MTRLLVRVVAFVLLGLTLVFATFDVSMAAKRECDGDGAPDRARQRREQRQQDREDKRDKRGNPASTSSKSLSESSISAGPASTAAPVIGAQPLDANQAVPVTTPQPVVATTPREPIVTAVASTSEVIDSDNQPRGTYGDKDIKQWLDKNGLSDVKPSDVRDNFNRLKNPSDLNARKNWKLLQDDVGNGEVKELERMMKRNDFKLDSIPVPPVPPAGGRPEPCPPDNKPDPAPIDRHPGQSPPDFGCRPHIPPPVHVIERTEYYPVYYPSTQWYWDDDDRGTNVIVVTQPGAKVEAERSGRTVYVTPSVDDQAIAFGWERDYSEAEEAMKEIAKGWEQNKMSLLEARVDRFVPVKLYESGVYRRHVDGNGFRQLLEQDMKDFGTRSFVIDKILHVRPGEVLAYARHELENPYRGKITQYERYTLEKIAGVWVISAYEVSVEPLPTR